MLSYGRWTFGVGDPTFLGWFTCLAYLITGMYCLFVYHANKTKNNKIVWVIIGTLFLLLAINKQLDLHRLITEFGRNLSHTQGWYQYRREAQFIFISTLIALCASLFFLVAIKSKHLEKCQALALLGLVFIISYALLKAMGFYHFVRIIPIISSFWPFLWILEITGIAITLLAVIQYKEKIFS